MLSVLNSSGRFQFFFKITSDFGSGARDERRDESADDADEQAAQADGEESGQSERVLLSGHVIRGRKGHHHRVKHNCDGICSDSKIIAIHLAFYLRGQFDLS